MTGDVYTTKVGDGNVTQTRAYFGSGGSDYYATDFQYDWRNRREQSRGPDKLASRSTFDNQGRTIRVERYYDGDSDFVIDSGELRGKNEPCFDEKGQVYQTVQYEVDSSGIVGHTLTSQFWYDSRGRQIKAQDPNGLFRNSAYDSAGRQTASFVCYDDVDEEGGSACGRAWR